MFKSLRKTALVAAFAVGSMTVATTADARDRYRHRGDDGAAIAVGAGILGLAVGAAIASDRGRDRYYYNDGYYYGRPRGGYHYRSYPRYRPDYPRYRDYYRYERRDYRGWDGRRYGGWRY